MRRVRERRTAKFSGLSFILWLCAVGYSLRGFRALISNPNLWRIKGAVTVGRSIGRSVSHRFRSF